MSKQKRTIHLHDEGAVNYLENYAAKNNIPLYKAMEEIIYLYMNGETDDHDMKLTISKFGSGQIIDSLLSNGYIIQIEPASDENIIIDILNRK